MYIPPMSENMQNRTMPRVRLLLQGASGKGKTWSALTFPNPVVLDLDDGLTAFCGQDVTVIPFHSYDFVMKYQDGKFKPKNEHAQPNRRDAILHFLKNEAVKLHADQTLVLDGLTGLEAAAAQQLKWEPKITDKGKIDDFAPWQVRLEYYGNVCTFLKSLSCHVVVTCHEFKIRNEQTGELMDKIGPLLQGKFVAQLASHFTDVFRCITTEKKDKQGKVESIEYFWQVRSDSMFDAKTRLLLPEGVVFVEPHYKLFEQYKQQEKKNPYGTK